MGPRPATRSGLAVPIYAAIIPIYRLSSDVGLYDTLLGLLLPFAATSLPITVFILTAFMRAMLDWRCPAYLNR